VKYFLSYVAGGHGKGNTIALRSAMGDDDLCVDSTKLTGIESGNGKCSAIKYTCSKQMSRRRARSSCHYTKR